MRTIEIVPAILRKTFEGIEQDWQRALHYAAHIQIDVTDGIFAGDGSFRNLPYLKKLPLHDKIELHMMVQHPAQYVDDIIALAPSRCAFHIESFVGSNDLLFVYEKLRECTSAELGIAVNPNTPTDRIAEFLPNIQYVLFMGYSPGRANQAIHPMIFQKIAAFTSKYPNMLVAVDGHVDKQTIQEYAAVGATILCANTAIFRAGDVGENIRQLELLARAAMH